MEIKETPFMDNLFAACRKGNIGVIRKVLKQGQIVNVVEEKTGCTPLMLVAAGAKDAPFQLVLKNTSDEYLHKINHKGENVLFYACRSNLVDRVRVLFVEKKVAVIRSDETGFAAELSTHPSIIALLREETQRMIDIHTSLLHHNVKDSETLGDVLDNLHHFSEKTGLSIRMRELKPGEIDEAKDTFNTEVKMETLKSRILDSPVTRTELKKQFEVERPKSVSAARRDLTERYGLTLTKEETKSVLTAAGVSTQRDLLKSVDVRRDLARHFKQFPPATVKEAMEYIQSTYSCDCDMDLLQRFLQHYGIEVPLELKEEL